MLRELQLELGRAFHEGGPNGPAARSVLGRLRALGGVEAAKTLSIYQGSIARAHEQALRDIYPVLAALVGGDCFRVVARELARRHPSTAPDLSRIGDRLPALVPALGFLDGVPYLADVARLELAWHRAWTDPDAAPVVDPERIALAMLARPEEHRFVLLPSLRLVASEHPVLEIWQAHQDVDECDVTLDLDSRREPSRLAVWRRDSELRVDRVESGLWPLLCSIDGGEPVSAQLRLASTEPMDDTGELLQQDPEDFAPVLETIRALFERGWIVGLEPVSGDEHGP